MTRARAHCGRAVLLCLLVTATGATIRAADQPLSVPQYLAKLDALISAIGAGETAGPRAGTLVGELPTLVRVDGSTRIFEVPTGSLRHDFHLWQTGSDSVARLRLLNGLHTMRSEAAGFTAPAVAPAAQQAQLTEILSGREFRDLHGPTWTDRLKQRLLEMLVGLLARLFNRSSVPTISTVLVYGLMTLAVVVLALATYRYLRRTTAAETMLSSRLIATPMDWPRWLAAAQAAAAAGSWRDAIHFTYWCAVAFLETKGAWRPDRARTPREYLRLLPSSSDDGATLAALTRRFELVWYGNAAADAAAFAESVANLKKMGCPAA
jgi:hypothetical protein